MGKKREEDRSFAVVKSNGVYAVAVEPDDPTLISIDGKEVAVIEYQIITKPIEWVVALELYAVLMSRFPTIIPAKFREMFLQPSKWIINSSD